MKYQVESFDSCIEEIIPLFYHHWREIAGHQDTVALNPDYDRYRQLEKLGMLRMYIARTDQWEVVGYFVTFIHAHMHYQNTVYGLNDIVYIKPEHRGGTVAHRLFRGAMKDLKDNCNVDILVIHMKIKHEFRKFLTSLGFTLAEENWEMVL